MLNEIKKKGKWVTEDYIQGLMKKHGMNHSEIEDIIKTEDFTSDGKQFNEAILHEFKWAWNQFLKASDPAKLERARKLYHELRDYLINELNKKSDFVDDGFGKQTKRSKKKFLVTLINTVEELQQTRDPEIKKRARKLYQELEKFIVDSDFTDDANFPVTNKLYSLLSQVLNILDRQMNRLEKEISKMNDRERDRLYDHPFIKEFKIDMLP